MSHQINNATVVPKTRTLREEKSLSLDWIWDKEIRKSFIHPPRKCFSWACRSHTLGGPSGLDPGGETEAWLAVGGGSMAEFGHTCRQAVIARWTCTALSALVLSSSVTLGKSPHLPEPIFSSVRRK